MGIDYLQLKRIKSIANKLTLVGIKCHVEERGEDVIFYVTKTRLATNTLEIPEGVTGISFRDELGFNWSGGKRKPSSSGYMDAVQNSVMINIEHIKLPTTMKVAWSNTFNSVCGIKRVTLAEGCREIEDYAFHYCSGLTEIDLPETLEKIGACVFSGTNFKKFIIPPNVTHIEKGILMSCEELQELVVEGNIDDIPADMCYGNIKLKSVKISNCHGRIGEKAFKGCGLTEIKIPENVEANRRELLKVTNT